MKNIDALNTVGKILLNVKKDLLENKDTPAVQELLLKTLNLDTLDKDILKKLKDNKVKEVAFINALLKVEEYSTKYGLLNIYKEKLSADLSAHGCEYFTTEVEGDNRVVIIRKLGISLSAFQRVFHIKSDEVNELISTGFFKKYCELKLNALRKDSIKEVKVTEKKTTHNLTFETTDVYYNEEKRIYNIDFRIILNLKEIEIKNAGGTSSSSQSKARHIANILSYLNKKYKEII